MADVNISVGASIDELSSQLERAKGLLTDLTTAFGVAFSIDAVKSAIEEMARLGEETESLAKILGITTVQVQQWAIVSRMGGAESDALATGMERLQRALQAAQNPMSRQAQALHAIGLSAGELAKLPLDQQIIKFGQALNNFADGGNKVAVVQDLMGRGAAKLIPQLEEMGKNSDELNKRLRDAGAIVLPETTKKLDALYQEGVIVKEAMSGLGQVMAGELADGMIAAGKEIEKVVGRLVLLKSAGALGDYFSTLISGVVEQMKRVGPEGMGAVAGGQQVQNEVIQIASDLQQKLSTIITTALAQVDAGIKAAPAGASGKPGVPNYGGAAEQSKLALQAAMDQIKIIDLMYKTEADAINNSVKVFQFGEQAKTNALISAVNTREDASLAALNLAESHLIKGTAEYQKVEDEKTQIVMKAIQDRQAAILKYTEWEQQQWKKAADTIAGAFNSQLHGLLAGTESFATALKNMFASLIESLIAEIIKLGVEWVAQQVFMATAGKAGLAAEATTFLSKIQADAALVFAGVFANLAPALGPAAAGPATASQASVLAQMANVPKFDTGIDYVPRDMLAMIHEGERVVPAAQNTNNFGGVSMNISAVDARSVANMLFNNRAVFQQIVNMLTRNNPSNASRLAGMV